MSAQKCFRAKSYLKAMPVEPLDGYLSATAQGALVYSTKPSIANDAGCRPVLACNLQLSVGEVSAAERLHL